MTRRPADADDVAHRHARRAGAVPATRRCAQPGLVLIPDIVGLRPCSTCPPGAPGRRARLGGGRASSRGPAGRHLTSRSASLGRHRSTMPVARRAVAAADLLAVDPMGITGFCMGGMFALKAAGTGRFDRAVAFYGMIRVPEQWRGEGVVEPLEAVTAPGACPTMAVVGTADRGRRLDDVAASRPPASRWCATRAPTTVRARRQPAEPSARRRRRRLAARDRLPHPVPPTTPTGVHSGPVRYGG